MLKQLLRDGAIYSLGRALSGLLSLGLLPLYTAWLTPAQYGLYDIGTLAITLAVLVVAVEVSQGAARFYCESDDPQTRRRYFSTALWFTAGTFAVFAGVALALEPWVGARLLGPDADARVFLLVIGSACAIALFRVALAQLRWMLRPRAFLLCSLAQVTATHGAAVWLIVSRGQGAEGLFLGLIAGNLLGMALALWSGRAGLAFSVSLESLREMLAFSAPLVLSSTAVYVAAYVDRIAIKELMTMADLGRYGVAYRIASGVELIMVGLDMAFMPLIYARYADPETPAQLATLLRRVGLAGAGVLLGLAALSPELLRVLAAADYRQAAGLIPLLAASIFLTKLCSLAPGLWIAKKTRVVAAINVFVGVLNLGLNLALIPQLGVWGAALATLLSAAAGCGLNLAASQAHYPAPHGWGRLLVAGALVFGAGAGLVALGARYPAFAPLGLGLKLGVALSALLTVCAALTTRAERGAAWGWVRRR